MPEINEITDIEPEVGNEDIRIDVPFDPSEINIKIIPKNIGQLVELLEDGLILIPKYQRLPNLWSDTKKSRFIESLMLDLPIPLFYFDESDDKKWYVVDGLQRMSTLEHFMIGKGDVGRNQEKFKLKNLEFLIEYNDKTWDELPKDIKRRINSNQVTINLIGKGTPNGVKYTIFSRINQGDVPLKAQEIRTALFQGYKAEFLESLVSPDTEAGQSFHRATGGSIKHKRQEDLDFVSRFMAFYLIGHNFYEPDMDSFLTKGTNRIPESQSEQEIIRRAFKDAMDMAYQIFENDAFRKRLSPDDSRKPINKPLFEVISVAFAKLNDREKERLLSCKEHFVDAFINLQSERSNFWNAISASTATKENAVSRNKEFSTMLSNFLND